MILASQPHYAAHLAPIAALVDIPGDVALVASHRDLVEARKHRPRRVILAQHGAGQSYGGDSRSASVAAYPGGDDNADVGLFLVPNEHAAGRWRERYPAASVSVVGSPRLDALPAREPGPGPVVAYAFHWDAHFVPEASSALRWHLDGIRRVAQRYRVIGHGHPRRRDLAHVYASRGVEYVPDVDDVFRRADVLVGDNSSVLYEFAATGRPVVMLNAPWYRRNVTHGLRFWDALPGPVADHPAEVVEAVSEALRCGVDDAAVDRVYAYRTGGAQRAADAIREWLQ